MSGPAGECRRRFSFYHYSGTVANGLWTLQWAAAAALALQRLTISDESWDRINVIVALICALFGGVHTFRTFPRGPDIKLDKEYPAESWGRRIQGWIGLVVWCGVGVLWNIGVARIILSGAHQGTPVNLLIMVPFSLVGWFLLLMIFVTLTMALDAMIEMVRKSEEPLPRYYPPGHGK